MSLSTLPIAVAAAPAESSYLEIRQHNAITTARYEMSACEMDIVFSLLSVLRKEDKPGTIYRIRVKELEQLTGRVWNYQRLLEATSNLRSREYHIEDNKHVLQVGLLASALYIKGEGIIELEISERMRRYLIDLKNNFTSYRLQSVFSLSSKYAKRIYQIASQWKDIGETKTFTLDEFKIMLSLKDPKGVEAEQYEKVSALQKYVLDVAKNQINKHTDLRINYELLKKGRSYHSIRFFVNAQAPHQLPIPFEDGADEEKQRRALLNLDELGIRDSKLINQILDDTKKLDALFSFCYKYKTGKLKADKNPGGLYLKMVGLR
ncbi:replication initiation protein [Hymenobacter terrestris]|uniref:Replication initiation protein n=1 Tax=Hymenobacter terrestris TaxID=2748310 RepID=A0ABX2Q907_9BACT|nr:replication initiation protein [Hymenobacter terrestris]NVO86760.1 replication initiation protein [Hymenobacter terrestris]